MIEERSYNSGWSIIHSRYPEALGDKVMFFTVDAFQFSLCYQKKALMLAEITYKTLKSLLCLAWCMLQ